MKVNQLINKLKQLPKNLDVYIADHDQGQFETSGAAGTCDLIDKNDMDDIENDKATYDGRCFPHTSTPKKYVVIRP